MLPRRPRSVLIAAALACALIEVFACHRRSASTATQARARPADEFVGDSQPAGFGIEGVGPDCPGPDRAAQYQNFHGSLSARLGEVLDADLHGTIYSGKGFVRNISRPDTETMPLIYSRANPVDPTSVWDFSRFVPDVIVVMMGGNDFAIGQPVDDGPRRSQRSSRRRAEWSRSSARALRRRRSSSRSLRR
jgi:hypothetical protein